MSVKISIIVFNFNGRGVERSQVRMADYYSNNGDLVDVVCFQDKGVFKRDLPENVNIHCLNANTSKQGVISLIKYFWKEKPEIVISAQDNINVSVLLARLFCPWDFKVSVSCRVSPKLWAEKPNVMSKNWLTKYLVQFLYPIASQRIMLSTEMANDYTKLFGLPLSSLKVIYNPVLKSKNCNNEALVEHPWLIEPSKKVVLAAGNISWIKGFDTLIKSIALLDKRLDIHLVILGEGPLLDSLQSLTMELGLCERVDFAGFHTNTMDFMKAADLFVLSSLSEGFGNVLVEAIGSGCPVIATRCGGGAVEIMEDGRLGPVIPISDEFEMAKAIESTIDNPIDKQILLNSAKRFYIDNICEQYLSGLINR